MNLQTLSSTRTPTFMLYFSLHSSLVNFFPLELNFLDWQSYISIIKFYPKQKYRKNFSINFPEVWREPSYSLHWPGIHHYHEVAKSFIHKFMLTAHISTYQKLHNVNSFQGKEDWCFTIDNFQIKRQEAANSKGLIMHQVSLPFQFFSQNEKRNQQTLYNNNLWIKGLLIDNI